MSSPVTYYNIAEFVGNQFHMIARVSVPDEESKIYGYDRAFTFNEGCLTLVNRDRRIKIVETTRVDDHVVGSH